MRKFLSLIISLVVIIVAFSATAVFADDNVYYFGSPSKTSDTVYSVPVYANIPADFEHTDTIAVKIKPTNCTISIATISNKASTDGFAIPTNQIEADGSGNYVMQNASSSASNTGSYELFTINVTKVADNASLEFTYANLYDSENDEEKGVSTSWGAFELWKNVSAATNTDLADYTDVVNFSSSLKNITATNPTLTFDLYEDGEFHKSYTESLINGVKFEGGTLTFKIAVYGAPTGKTITLQNPAVK